MGRRALSKLKSHLTNRKGKKKKSLTRQNICAFLSLQPANVDVEVTPRLENREKKRSLPMSPSSPTKSPMTKKFRRLNLNKETDAPQKELFDKESTSTTSSEGIIPASPSRIPTTVLALMQEEDNGISQTDLTEIGVLIQDDSNANLDKFSDLDMGFEEMLPDYIVHNEELKRIQALVETQLAEQHDEKPNTIVKQVPTCKDDLNPYYDCKDVCRLRLCNPGEDGEDLTRERDGKSSAFRSPSDSQELEGEKRFYDKAGNDEVSDLLPIQTKEQVPIEGNCIPSPELLLVNDMGNATCTLAGRGESLKEMLRLTPCVVDTLHREGLDTVLVDFFRELEMNRFPLDNMAFRVWTEVVRWYRNKHSSSMRYSNDTKQFWKLGHQLFGPKFIRFMTGYKNESDIVSGNATTGLCSSMTSRINFAVPSIQNLSASELTKHNRNEIKKPGIFNNVIHEIAEEMTNKSTCLTFDGKKIKQGLTAEYGDVDLLGFEPGESLHQKQLKLEHEIESQEKQKEEIMNDKLTDEQIKADLRRIHILLSRYIEAIIEIKERKEYARKKFVEQGGDDWRLSKYKIVISSIDAYLYDIEKWLSKARNSIEAICSTVACFQHTSEDYCLSETVCLDNLTYKEFHSESAVKQRTKEWFELRKRAKVTGSTLNKAIGLETLKDEQTHFESVICGVEQPPPAAVVQQNMDYGALHEIDAVATAIAKVIPVVLPKMVFHEEGGIPIPDFVEPFIVISPDGSLYTRNENKPALAVELKCPVLKVHNKIPNRYVLQCLCEMEALDVDALLFLSWRPDVSTAFILKRDKQLFTEAINVARDIYCCEKPKRPTKLPTQTKDLKKKIQAKVDEAEFLGEFPSVTVNKEAQVSKPEKQAHKDDLLNLYNTLTHLTKEYYELRREKATEAMVFLLCDLDRNSKDSVITCAPVCWCTKGYSLSTDVMRRLMEAVLDVCHTSGIHVPACSFDGQWHNIAVRSVDGKSLTLLQLHKDVWKSVQAMHTADIQNEIKNINTNPQWRFDYILRKESDGYRNVKVCICTNGGDRLPALPNRTVRLKAKRGKTGKTSNSSGMSGQRDDKREYETHHNTRDQDETREQNYHAGDDSHLHRGPLQATNFGYDNTYSGQHNEREIQTENDYVSLETNNVRNDIFNSKHQDERESQVDNYCVSLGTNNLKNDTIGNEQQNGRESQIEVKKKSPSTDTLGKHNCMSDYVHFSDEVCLIDDSRLSVNDTDGNQSISDEMVLFESLMENASDESLMENASDSIYYKSETQLIPDETENSQLYIGEQPCNEDIENVAFPFTASLMKPEELYHDNDEKHTADVLTIGKTEEYPQALHITDDTVIDTVVHIEIEEGIVANEGYAIYDECDYSEASIQEDDGKGTVYHNIAREKNITDTNIEEDQIGNMPKDNKRYEITKGMATSVLKMLRSDPACNKKHAWDQKEDEDIIKLLSSTEKLKASKDCELKIIVRFFKRTLGLKLKESNRKADKLTDLYSLLGLIEAPRVNNTMKAKSEKKRKLASLKELSFQAFKKHTPKSVLNVVFAEYIWPQKMKQWQEESNLDTGLLTDGLQCKLTWFYQPEYSRRHKFEVRCIDSTHLFTRMRRSTCHGGVEGLSNDPWLQVAKTGNTFLTPVMVTDIVDPMSMSMANTHFGKPVQEEMLNLGLTKAAVLCQDISNWWTAEDEPAIPALERMKLRMALRNRLMGYVDFNQFPSPGTHIEGWPTVLWEATIASIDAKSLLYPLCKSGTYNVRAFSSMMGETFFSELTHHDRSSHGTVSAEEFGRYISKCVEQMHVRLDPDRAFHYHTSKSRSYRPVEQLSRTPSDDVFQDNHLTSAVKINCIVPRNHFFDTEERRRLKGKRKMGTISKNRNSLQKGTLGVRWEKARTNQGKMLMTKKMGIE